MSSTRTAARPRHLNLEALEAREVPASLQIVFDYRFDTNGFFNDPTRRSTLEQAGRDLASRLDNTVDLAAIAPAGPNRWTATTFNPSNPNQNVSVANLNVASDTIVVFVGGQPSVDSDEAGLGGNGGYSASGSPDWFSTIRKRGKAGFSTWGGSLSFSSDVNWNFSLSSPNANQIDFYSVAVHELGHTLGFGGSNEFDALAQGSQFVGANARAANNGTNPSLSANDPGHWQQGIRSNGQPVSMQPIISAGARVGFSNLDYAALADIGWEVSAGTSPPVSPPVASPPITPPVSPPPVTTPIVTSPVVGTNGADPVVVGGSSGTFQQYVVAGGQLLPSAAPVTPWAGYTGSIRVATGDFTGDGTEDIAVAKGPGEGPSVKVYDGRTMGVLTEFFAFEFFFSGGVMLAAGDFNADGKDDLVVGADANGGPRVRIFNGIDTSYALSDFWGIDDKDFRGGVRIAAGDINGDGKADLVVAAGPGGGPRVAVYNGATVGDGAPDKLIGDFYSFPLDQAYNGCYVAIADIDGDGFGDVVFGSGSGAPRIRIANGYVMSQTNGNYSLDVGLGSYTLPATAGNYNGGARVAAGDYNGDGRAEWIGGLGDGGNGGVYLGSNGGYSIANPFGTGTLKSGVFVG